MITVNLRRVPRESRAVTAADVAEAYNRELMPVLGEHHQALKRLAMAVIPQHEDGPLLDVQELPGNELLLLVHTLSPEAVGAGGVTVALPLGELGDRVVVKDWDGNAAAINITVTCPSTIDGVLSFTVTNDYGYVAFLSDGATWGQIG